MLGVDDEGNKFELAPDPMNEELQEQFKDIVVGKPETFNQNDRSGIRSRAIKAVDRGSGRHRIVTAAYYQI